jgi:hypothetical protein
MKITGIMTSHTVTGWGWIREPATARAMERSSFRMILYLVSGVMFLVSGYWYLDTLDTGYSMLDTG